VKTERRPAAFSAVTASHCPLQTGPWAGPQPETNPRGVSPNRPSANSANCAGDRRLRNGFAWCFLGLPALCTDDVDFPQHLLGAALRRGRSAAKMLGKFQSLALIIGTQGLTVPFRGRIG